MKTKTETKQLVTKDMLIGEIISKHPEVAQVMLSYGLHCVGCSANPFDTIESGCMVHGMDSTTVDKLVNDINKTIDKLETRKDNVVSITKEAAKRFKEFMKEDHKENCGVRISVFGGGCDGFQYGLDFAEKPTKTEEVIEEQGIKFFIDKSFLNVVKGTEIDFI